MGNININVTSDVNLTKFKLSSGATVDNLPLWVKNKWTRNEWELTHDYDISSEVNSATTNVNGKISTQPMQATENRYLKFNTEAEFNGCKISTPTITITQHKHPDVYEYNQLELITSMGTIGPGEENIIELDEMGETLYVRASTKINNDTKRLVVDEECYHLSISGDCIYRQTNRPTETNNYIEWEIQLAQNISNNDRTLQIGMKFYYEDNLIWGGEESPKILYIRQRKHTPVCEGFVFKADNNIIPASGSVANIEAYYTRDGVLTALPEASSSGVFGSKLLEMETPQQNGQMNYTITFKPNPDPATPNGNPSRMMYWKTSVGEKKLNILFLQKTEKQVGSELYFTNDADTIDKVINTAYGPQRQTISFDITSLKEKVPTDIQIVGDGSYNDMFSSSAYTNGSLVLSLNENTTPSIRSSKITISQVGDDTHKLTLTLRQGGIEYQESSDFDYMVINIAHDKISCSTPLSLQIRATGWSSEYNSFSCVGSDAYNYLGDYVSDELRITESNYGDTTNSRLRWGGASPMYGVESFVINPKEFLKNSVINAGSTKEIVFEVYALAKRSIGSGLMTIKLQGYTSQGENNGPDTIPNTLANNNTVIFTPQMGDTQTVNELHHLMIPDQEGSYSVKYSAFTKVFEIKYNIENYSWSYLNLSPYTFLDTKKEVSTEIITHEVDTSYREKVSISGSSEMKNSLKEYYNGRMNIIGYNKDRTNHTTWSLEYGMDTMYLNKLNSGSNDNIYTLIPLYDQTEYQLVKIGICGINEQMVEYDYKSSLTHMMDLGFTGDTTRAILYFSKNENITNIYNTVYTKNLSIREIYIKGYSDHFIGDNTIPWNMEITGKFTIHTSKSTSFSGEYTILPAQSTTFQRTMTLRSFSVIPSNDDDVLMINSVNFKLPADKSGYILEGLGSTTSNGKAPTQPLNPVKAGLYKWQYNVNPILILYWNGYNVPTSPSLKSNYVYAVNYNEYENDWTNNGLPRYNWTIKGKLEYWAEGGKTLYQGSYTIDFLGGVSPYGYRGEISYECPGAARAFDDNANSYILLTSAEYTFGGGGADDAKFFEKTKTRIGFFDGSTKPTSREDLNFYCLQGSFPGRIAWYYNKKPYLMLGFGK